MSRVLVTGASGFLGSALTRHFVGAGHEVAALLRPTSTLARLEPIAERVHIARAGSDNEIRAAVEAFHPQAIVHTACAYGRQGESTLQVFEANVRFGMQLLEAVRATGGTIFLNTGSALDPLVSPYALSKAHFSQWGAFLATSGKGALQFVNVRLQHMYGPGDDASKFTTHVIRSCARHEARLALTAGEQQRDFIYIDDVLSAYDLLLAKALNGELPKAFDVEVGSGDAPTIRSFVEAVHEIARSRTQLDFGAVPYRPNEAMLCRADIGAMRALGWAPTCNLREGITRTLKLEGLKD